jgi:hypothetical protein
MISLAALCLVRWPRHSLFETCGRPAKVQEAARLNVRCADKVNKYTGPDLASGPSGFVEDKSGNVETGKAGNLGPPASGDPTQSKNVGPARQAVRPPGGLAAAECRSWRRVICRGAILPVLRSVGEGGSRPSEMGAAPRQARGPDPFDSLSGSSCACRTDERVERASLRPYV